MPLSSNWRSKKKDSKPLKPNIVVIVADDLGWSDVGFHSKTIDTPNLVKLANQSTELSRFYTYPLCSPTRAALLTGNSPRRVSMFSALGPRQQGLPSGTTTLPSILSKEGYNTSLVGKWHLGKSNTPQTAGFDHFYGFLNAEVNYFKHTGQTGNIDWQRDGKTINEEGYSTYLLANEASSQIKSNQGTNQNRSIFSLTLMPLTFLSPPPMNSSKRTPAKEQS